MAATSDEADRYAASLAVFAGSLASAAVFVLTEFVTVGRPAVVASTPIAVIGVVTVAVLLVRDQK